MKIQIWKCGALFTLLAVSSMGQNIRGTILGTVRDATGAVISGAKVTVRQPSTGFTQEHSTNNVGEYLFTELPVGTYTVTAERDGFQTQAKQNIPLEVDQRVREDFTLAVGAVTQTATVEATTPVISTDSATVGNVIDNQQVTGLPLNGRNPLQLVTLVPGVNNGVKGSQNQTQGGSVSINGAREQSNNFLLDGVDNNDLAINQWVVPIDPDAMEEFKVAETTYTAEYGRSGGGQINYTSKSGSNSFHGVAYEYLRNDDLDARNFFDPQNIPPYKRNQFGASLGGPVKKDRTFFFFNWESTRVRFADSKVGTVPTAAMHQGNFSALATPVYDPNSISSTGQRTPFGGNIIPPTEISAVGQNVLNLYPLPTSPNNASSGLYASSPAASDDFNQYNGRVDHRFNDSDSLFGRYSFYDENRLNTFDSFCAGSHNLPGYGCNTLNGGQSFLLGEIHLLGATKINELRLGYNRARGGIFQQDQSTDNSTALGILGTSRNPLDFGTPLIEPTGYDTEGDATNLPQDRKDNTYQVTDTFSWSRGKHNFKFGEDFRRFQLNLLFDSAARGTLVFQNFYTSQAANSSTGGSSIADLLLGDPYDSSISHSFAGPSASDVTGFRTSSLDFFAQDDWRVTPQLSLNLGIRWEYNSPVIDKYNHLATFDANVPGDIETASSSKQNLYTTSKDQFAPRFGFAYTPFGNSTVFRGGYGIFWDEKLLNILLTPALSPPFVVPLSFNPSTNGIPNISLANPYSGSATTAVPSSTWLESPFKQGYVQQWSFNVQHQFPSDLGLTVGYVGSEGIHLDREYNANLPEPSPLFSQANRPYPNFASLTVDSASAWSNYNALQIEVEKKLSKGLTFLAGYTYSKSIDTDSSWNATVVDPFNFRTERGLSTFDTRDRFILSYVYQIPVGKGRAALSNMNGVGDFFLGGWQTDGILSAQSGNPIDTSAGLATLTGTNTIPRPDLVAGCNPNDISHSVFEWFNTACFSDNFLGRFGDAGRDVVIGPGEVEWDPSLLKNFVFKETRYVQFRAELFNVLNHPNFDNPTTTETSSTFGRITSAGVQDPRLTSRQIQFALRLVF